jgi:hypothetical protein
MMMNLQHWNYDSPAGKQAEPYPAKNQDLQLIKKEFRLCTSTSCAERRSVHPVQVRTLADARITRAL